MRTLHIDVVLAGMARPPDPSISKRGQNTRSHMQLPQTGQPTIQTPSAHTQLALCVNSGQHQMEVWAFSQVRLIHAMSRAHLHDSPVAEDWLKGGNCRNAAIPHAKIHTPWQSLKMAEAILMCVICKVKDRLLSSLVPKLLYHSSSPYNRFPSSPLLPTAALPNINDSCRYSPQSSSWTLDRQ